MKENYFLSLAKKESNKSDHHSHKLGCLIVRKNKILGMGHNMVKTHTKSPHKFKSIHAEFLAILNSGENVKGATAYIYRQQKNGVPALSRPCESCWKYLYESGIKKVVYSFEGNFKEERL